MKVETIIRIVLICLVVAALLLVALFGFGSRQNIDYSDHLEDVCVTVDGEEMTLSDLAFYVTYVECAVEQDARIYDKDNTRAFWNIHTNQTFNQTMAKETAMNMAIHDRIFYRAALQENMVLNAEEAAALENRRTDFWEDLLDVQRDRLPTSFEVMNETMKEIALAEKYQRKLAEEKNTTYAAYNYDGYDYEQLLKEHKVKVKKRVWDRVNVGNVTLVHDEVLKFDK